MKYKVDVRLKPEFNNPAGRREFDRRFRSALVNMALSYEEVADAEAHVERYQGNWTPSVDPCRAQIDAG